MSGDKRDFLTILDVSSAELEQLIARGAELKAMRARGEKHHPLDGKTLAMVFEKASTRTRVSFEVGTFELGGHGVYISTAGSQIARGEPIQDTARVLSGYCQGIVMRTFGHERVEKLAEYASVPVVNGLTDEYHPCQIVADLLTVKEELGDYRGLRYAWVGDGNNMAHSWINAAARLGFEVAIACPEGFEPDAAIVERVADELRETGGKVSVVREPEAAVANAHVVSTDVWASMGQEEEAAERRRAFAGYCVTDELLASAAKDAIVLHCLPAHRGEEITESVIEGARSRVWSQAENRLHAQKALLEFLMA